MKQNLTINRIKTKIRSAYAFQIESRHMNSEYFDCMTQALYEFACASMQIQKAVLKDRICRAAVAAWIDQSQPTYYSAVENSDDENEIITAAENDSAMDEYMKKYFTAEAVFAIFSWTGYQYIRWDDKTVTETPGHSQIGMYLGKHYGTRRRLVPSGERRIRGAH